MSSPLSEKRPVLVVAAIGLLIAAVVVIFITRLPLPIRIAVCATNVIAVAVLAVAIRQLPPR
jgi:FtsH-binding integral membrane protein